MSARKFAPRKSARLRRAKIRAPERFAPVKFGASAADHSKLMEPTASKSDARERSAPVKLARVSDVRSSFAPDDLTGANLASVNLAGESEKAPNDPAVLKSLGARHLDLMKEDEALKKDVDEIQNELNAMKE